MFAYNFLNLLTSIFHCLGTLDVFVSLYFHCSFLRPSTTSAFMTIQTTLPLKPKVNFLIQLLSSLQGKLNCCSISHIDHHPISFQVGVRMILQLVVPPT